MNIYKIIVIAIASAIITIPLHYLYGGGHEFITSFVILFPIVFTLLIIVEFTGIGTITYRRCPNCNRLVEAKKIPDSTIFWKCKQCGTRVLNNKKEYIKYLQHQLANGQITEEYFSKEILKL